jgi:predicted transcriptional regulator
MKLLTIIYQRLAHVTYIKKTTKMETNKKIIALGKLMKTQDGKVICRICNKSFHNLGNHVKRTHKIDPDEYRAMYGLNSGCSLCSDSLADKRREVINKHPELIEKLIENGQETQMRKGEATYTADKVRKQALHEREYSQEHSDKLSEWCKTLGKSKKGVYARWGDQI